MCLSVELLFTPTEAIAKILFNTIEEFLQSKKYLIRLVGNSSYSMDKFAWLNISFNRKMYVKEGEKQEIVPFSLGSCFSCNQMLNFLS